MKQRWKRKEEKLKMGKRKPDTVKEGSWVKRKEREGMKRKGVKIKKIGTGERKVRK